MHGILCIDKPEGFTSFDVVAKFRGIAKTRKVGHGGTLDPMATGVLPLFLNNATKASDLLPNQEKAYTATFKLGIVTDTLDITGTVEKTSIVNVNAETVEETIKSFLGKSSQLPPMYSAVQVGGVRLYDLARQGEKVERKPRDIEIKKIDLLSKNIAEHEYTIDVSCSKGAYIRSLCYDIGEKLGCGATLTALRRTKACGYGLDACITLAQAQKLADAGKLFDKLLPVESAFTDLPALHLNSRQTFLLLNGVRMRLDQVPTLSPDENGLIAAFSQDNVFLGLVFINDGELHVKRLFLREVPA